MFHDALYIDLRCQVSGKTHHSILIHEINCSYNLICQEYTQFIFIFRRRISYSTKFSTVILQHRHVRIIAVIMKEIRETQTTLTSGIFYRRIGDSNFIQFCLIRGSLFLWCIYRRRKDKNNNNIFGSVFLPCHAAFHGKIIHIFMTDQEICLPLSVDFFVGSILPPPEGKQAIFQHIL